MRRGLAWRDANGRPHARVGGQLISEAAYRELKEREKDKRYRAAETAEEKRKAQLHAEVARRKTSQKKRAKTLRTSGTRIPSVDQRSEQLERGRLTGQLHSSTPTFNTTVYVFEGIESLPLVRAFIRDVLAEESPPPLVRVTLRAGNGKSAESIGSFYETPRGALRYVGSVEHRQSAKELLARAEETGETVYIEVEVKRLRKNRGRRGDKANAGRVGSGSAKTRVRTSGNVRPKPLPSKPRRKSEKRKGSDGYRGAKRKR